LLRTWIGDADRTHNIGPGTPSISQGATWHKERQGTTGSKVIDARDLPASQNGIGHGIHIVEVFPSFAKWKFVDAVNSQDMGSIERGTTSVVTGRRKRSRCSPEVVCGFSNVLREGIRCHVRQSLTKSSLPLQQQAVIPGVSNVL